MEDNCNWHANKFQEILGKDLTGENGHSRVLGMETASWIIRVKETKVVIMETYDPAKVAALNTAKYEAIPVYEYLCELNEEIKALPSSACHWNENTTAIQNLEVTMVKG